MEQVGFGDSVVAKLGRLTVCARADGRGMGPKCLFAEQAARLAALDDGGQLVAERPCLLRVAEHAAPLPGRRLELAEDLGLSELLVGHFGGNRIDEADALIEVVVALPALLVHAAEHEFHARLRREVVAPSDAGQENQQRDAESPQHFAMLPISGREWQFSRLALVTITR